MLSNPKQKSGNQPTHLVYHVEERAGDNPNYWTRIGACWPHQDGKGLNLELQFLPINSNGRLVIRLNESKEQDDQQAAQAQPVA